MHRIALVGNDPTARATLEALGFRTSEDKPGVNSWTYDAMSASMATILERAETISRAVNADINLSARLGKNSGDVIEGKALPFTPAASVRPGMIMFDATGGYDVVETVEVVSLEAPVYDLDIERTHNFIANGIVTHNSIYSWRGANPKVLFQFEQDFPNTRVVLLEQNYRSTQIVLDAAHGVVSHNRGRKDKKLWTKRGRREDRTARGVQRGGGRLLHRQRDPQAGGAWRGATERVRRDVSHQRAVARAGGAVHPLRHAVRRRRQQEVLRAQGNS